MLLLNNLLSEIKQLKDEIKFLRTGSLDKSDMIKILLRKNNISSVASDFRDIENLKIEENKEDTPEVKHKSASQVDSLVSFGLINENEDDDGDDNDAVSFLNPLEGTVDVVNIPTSSRHLHTKLKIRNDNILNENINYNCLGKKGLPEGICT